jgi:hypothetical protein
MYRGKLIRGVRRQHVYQMVEKRVRVPITIEAGTDQDLP